jgi:hypothetical protein
MTQKRPHSASFPMPRGCDAEAQPRKRISESACASKRHLRCGAKNEAVCPKGGLKEMLPCDARQRRHMHDLLLGA